MRLIDADALKEELIEPNVWWETESQAQRIIDTAPTIDPVKHGKWLFTTTDIQGLSIRVCSECGFQYPFALKKFNYCPMCGATMEGR